MAIVFLANWATEVDFDGMRDCVESIAEWSEPRGSVYNSIDDAKAACIAELRSDQEEWETEEDRLIDFDAVAWVEQNVTPYQQRYDLMYGPDFVASFTVRQLDL